MSDVMHFRLQIEQGDPQAAEQMGYFTDTLQRLIDLYTAWEKPDEAAKWQMILEERKMAHPATANSTENP